MPAICVIHYSLRNRAEILTVSMQLKWLFVVSFPYSDVEACSLICAISFSYSDLTYPVFYCPFVR